MIDFRYHLVSLGAVFIALAVGIILGAGPLQNSIGNVLNSQVQALSDANSKLKEEMIEYQETIAQNDAAWEDLAPSLVQGSLTGRSVALISLPGVSSDEITAVSERLVQAGASINMQVTINQSWTAADQTAYRTTFASQLASYIEGGDPNTDPNTLMTDALYQLTVNGIAFGQNVTLRDILTGSDEPMMTLAKPTDGPAQVVVILSPDTDQDDIDKRAAQDPEVQAQATYDAQTFAALGSRFSSKIPTVVVGSADSAADVARVVRDLGDASTVDNLSDSMIVGSINTVMAVAHELNNNVVHLGFDDGAGQALSQRVESVKPEDPPAPAPAAQPAPAPTEEPAPQPAS
ncbi:copper transporter [Arcanobacterium pinnipediorum]|uniref:Copper transporter n=1 Tax=Arcanobacterium pinnipediorum TaxID=1503041 RepID=A0ABY5AHH3_9ACTO|nr:copper transporter [Arcanobacterium pinnipediorum]USR78704.1 copper transporter [Arcanobacterium pinnipediorum]